MEESSYIGSTPRSEAVAFFRFFRKGESLAKLRATIQPGAESDLRMTLFRENVLSHFDSFVRAGRVVRVPTRRKKSVPHGSKRRRHRWNHGTGI